MIRCSMANQKLVDWIKNQRAEGYSYNQIYDALSGARNKSDAPTMILAHTVMGKGVSFMENLPEWHGKPPDSEEAKKALHELRTLGGKITGEHE